MTSDRVSDKYVADMLVHPDGKRIIGSTEFRLLLQEIQHLRSPVTVSNEMVERGLAEYSEGGCMGLDESERREVVTSILTAALVPAEQAGVEFRYNGEGYSVAEPIAPTPGGDSRVVAAMPGEVQLLLLGLRRDASPDNSLRLDRVEAILSSLEAVERERDEAVERGHGWFNIAQDYMARAVTVEASLAAAREALRPFAAIAEDYSEVEDDSFQVWKDFDTLGSSLPLSIFRRARAALAGSNGE